VSDECQHMATGPENGTNPWPPPGEIPGLAPTAQMVGPNIGQSRRVYTAD
jgi:hypothetical protein